MPELNTPASTPELSVLQAKLRTSSPRLRLPPYSVSREVHSSVGIWTHAPRSESNTLTITVHSTILKVNWSTDTPYLRVKSMSIYLRVNSFLSLTWDRWPWFYGCILMQPCIMSSDYLQSWEVSFVPPREIGSYHNHQASFLHLETILCWPRFQLRQDEPVQRLDAFYSALGLSPDERVEGPAPVSPTEDLCLFGKRMVRVETD